MKPIALALLLGTAGCLGSAPGASPDATSTADADAPTAADGTATPDTPASPPDAAPDTPVTPPPVTFETFIGDWVMVPGQETTRCVVKRLPNKEPIYVSAITTKLAPGSHHLIIYRNDAAEEQPEPYECTPFIDVIDGEAYPLMITQVSEETLRLPEGVALRLEPGQMIRMEAHYLNYFNDNITAHADVTFETIPEAQVQAEAGVMLYGTPDIDLPPHTEVVNPWFFLEVWADALVFAITGHTHQYGTNVEIYQASDVDDDSTPIYPLDQTFAWDESPIITYEPPLAFGEGDGIRYRCSWDNTSPFQVGFGESANQEMCFSWLYYYPSQGYRLCVNTGSWKDFAPGLIDDVVCCPGNPLCGLVKSYLGGGF